MPEDTLSDFQQQLAKAAWRVHALVRDNAVLERFRKMIWRWYLDVKLRDSERSILMRRREQHMDAILATLLLRYRSAGPPRPDWEWWQTARSVLANDDMGWPHEIVYVEGWAPPELTRAEPKEYWPLPLSKRPLRIEEKYTLLAAIHDKFCRGVKRISSWPEGDVEGTTYLVFYHQHVPQLLKSEDRPAIEAFLADVEENLRTATGKLVQEPSDAARPATAGAGEEDARAKELPTERGTEDPSASIEQWETATKATEIANRLTRVNRDWSSYWRGFCEKYNVVGRPGTKTTGEPTKYRREVELGSLVRAIRQHSEDFERATPEKEKRRQVIEDRIHREHGFTSEFQKELLRSE